MELVGQKTNNQKLFSTDCPSTSWLIFVKTLPIMNLSPAGGADQLAIAEILPFGIIAAA